jgi:hypothetical protein
MNVHGGSNAFVLNREAQGVLDHAGHQIAFGNQ